MIEIGDTVHLELRKDKMSKGERVTYSGKLVGRKKGLLIIENPVNKETRENVFFMEGTELSAWFIGEDHAVYSFFTEVTGRKSKKRNTLMLKDPGAKRYTRIQRRNHVRVRVSLDVAVHPKKENVDPFVTTSLDISGGGLAITSTDHPLEAGDNVKVWLVLYFMNGSVQYVTALCKIVRVGKEEIGHYNRYSLQFLQIEDEDRQKVIDYCFEKQLPRRTIKSRNH